MRWRRRPAISPFSSLAARIARWRSVLRSSLRPRARLRAGDPDDVAVANPRRASTPDYRDFRFSARHCCAAGEAARRRGSGPRCGREPLVARVRRASTWGRKALPRRTQRTIRLAIARSSAARVYKGLRRTPVRNGDARHPPSISWRRNLRLKRAVKGAPCGAPPAAVETLDSPFQSERFLSKRSTANCGGRDGGGQR